MKETSEKINTVMKWYLSQTSFSPLHNNLQSIALNLMTYSISRNVCRKQSSSYQTLVRSQTQMQVSSSKHFETHSDWNSHLVVLTELLQSIYY